MKFLSLHYKTSGKKFLINTSIIAGVEMNGEPENGSVLTLTTPEQRYEIVKEQFDEISGLLWGSNLMAK